MEIRMPSDLANVAGLGLKRQLKGAWLNHQAISNNIANVNTPGYQGTRIETPQEKRLRMDLDVVRTAGSHMASFEFPLTQDMKKVPVTELSIDSEMAEMTKNNLFYHSLVEAIDRRDKMARTAMG